MTSKKVGLVSLSLLLLAFLSCTSEPDVPLVYSKTVPTTTSTTIKPPALVARQTPATPTTVSTESPPKTILPLVLEPELRNLFATVYNSYKELLLFEIDKLFPLPSEELIERFEKVRMNYEIQIWRWPYDGETSHPFFVELKELGKQLSALVDKGLPLRSEAERKNALVSADQSRAAKTAKIAEHRFVDAQAALDSGNTYHSGAKYRSSITYYKKATILFNSANAKTIAEKAKSELIESGLDRYSPFLRIEADRRLTEDDALYALADNDSIQQGISLLNWATRLYNQAQDWGIECLATAEKDRALIAKRYAALDLAEINAIDDYKKALGFFADGESKLSAGAFSAAADLFKNAITSFEKAQTAARQAASDAMIAREVARVKLEHLQTKIEAAGFEEDANFQRAKKYISTADEKLLAGTFENSRLDSIDAISQIAISNGLLEERLNAKRATIQAEADRFVAEQARLLAQKQAEIDSLFKEKAKVEEKLAEVEKQLLNALAISSSQIQNTSDSKSLVTSVLEQSNLDNRLAEMELAIKKLIDEQSKLESAVADAKYEASRIASIPITVDSLSSKPIIPEVIAPKSTPTLPVPSEPELIEPSKPVPVPPEPESPLPIPPEPQSSAPEIVQPKDQKLPIEDPDKTLAESSIKEAQIKYEWAILKNAENNYPISLATGTKELEAAKMAFETKDFTAASAKAKSALNSFSDIAEFAELPMYYPVGALPTRRGLDSLSRIASYPFVYNDVLKWPFLYTANKANLPDPANPDLIRHDQLILIPSIRGETRIGTWDSKKTYRTFEKDERPEVEQKIQAQALQTREEAPETLKAAALVSLENSRIAYDQAILRNAQNNYPSLLENGAKSIALAEKAFDAGDYRSASTEAESARQALLAIKKFAPLPAKYKVRRIPSGTDSYWQIAGYPFVFGNSYKWQKLFEANRGLHNDPNLIRPGDVIIIPSLSGEIREGTWDPLKTYPPLPK